MKRTQWPWRAFGVLTLFLFLVVACGDGDSASEPATEATAEPTATQEEVRIPPTAEVATPTPTPEPDQAPTATPTPTATAVTTDTAEPTPEASGTANISGKTEPPIFRVSLSGRGWADALLTRYGAFEGLLRADYRPVPEWGPIGSEGIAHSWEIAPDNSQITFHLREGVKFHNGWGEVTAEDVAFSYNDAIRPDSVFTRAAPFSEWMDSWEAIDDHTVVLHLKVLEPTWATKLSNAGDTTAPIVSKKAFDELGSETFNTTDMGTGPFTVRKWETNNEIIMDRFPDYFREEGLAHVASVRYITMPEQSVQVASLETGELDIATGASGGLEPPLVKGAAERSGGDVIGIGAPSGAEIHMAGNFWAETNPDTGEPLERRPGFKPDEDHPWIGDPWGDGNDMESARLVRQAMAMAIDRDLLVETMMDGLGSPAYTEIGSVPGDDVWKEDWFVPYDPERARELLDEAGYPDGFSFTYWQGIDSTAYLADAVVQMWGDIGLSASIDTTVYDAYRPKFVDRSLSIPYMHGGSKGKGFDEAKGEGYVPTMGGGKSVEMPDEISALHFANKSEQDYDKRVQNNIEMQDWLSHWRINIPTVYDLGRLYITNVGVDWRPHQADFGFFNSPEEITLDR